jgi:hypothetical protein
LRGNLSVTGDLLVEGPLRLDTPGNNTTVTADQVRFTGTVKGSEAAEQLRLMANEVDFMGGASSVGTLAELAIQAAPGVTGYRLGSSTDTGPTILDLTDADLAAIDSSTALVTVGALGVAGTLPIVVDSTQLATSLALRAESAQITLVGNVKTLGQQQYFGPVLLEHPADTTTLDGTEIAFLGGGTTLDSAVAGSEGLVVNASVAAQFEGAIGAGAALRQLTVTAPLGVRLNGGAVTTTQDQQYTGPVTLGAAGTATVLTGRAILFPTVLSTISSARSALGGAGPAQSLQVAATGRVLFAGAVGAVNSGVDAGDRLQTLVVSAGADISLRPTANSLAATALPGVLTIGDQRYVSGGAITIGARAQLQAEAGTLQLFTTGGDAGDITLGLLATGNASAGAVVVYSDGGIFDGAAVGSEPTAGSSASDVRTNIAISNSVGVATLLARRGSIGQLGNSLDTRVAVLVARAMVGDVVVSEADSLVIGTGTTTNSAVTLESAPSPAVFAELQSVTGLRADVGSVDVITGQADEQNPLLIRLEAENAQTLESELVVGVPDPLREVLDPATDATLVVVAPPSLPGDDAVPGGLTAAVVQAGQTVRLIAHGPLSDFVLSTGAVVQSLKAPATAENPNPTKAVVIAAGRNVEWQRGAAVRVGRASVVPPGEGAGSGGLAEARFISPRPAAGVSGTAFFDAVDVEAAQPSAVRDIGGGRYEATFEIELGQLGERGLRIDIDWGAPSNRYQTVFTDTTLLSSGSRQLTLKHIYTSEEILTSRLNGRTMASDPFRVLFSVSQNTAIAVFGTQAGGQKVENFGRPALLSSTDTRTNPEQPLFTVPTSDSVYENGVFLFFVPRLPQPESAPVAPRRVTQIAAPVPIALPRSDVPTTLTVDPIFRQSSSPAYEERPEYVLRIFESDSLDREGRPREVEIKRYSYELLFDQDLDRQLLSEGGDRIDGRYRLLLILGSNQTELRQYEVNDAGEIEDLGRRFDPTGLELAPEFPAQAPTDNPHPEGEQPPPEARQAETRQPIGQEAHAETARPAGPATLQSTAGAFPAEVTGQITGSAHDLRGESSSSAVTSAATGEGSANSIADTPREEQKDGFLNMPAGTVEEGVPQANREASGEAVQGSPDQENQADFAAGSLVAVAGVSLMGDWRRRRSGSTLTERRVERY